MFFCLILNWTRKGIVALNKIYALKHNINCITHLCSSKVRKHTNKTWCEILMKIKKKKKKALTCSACLQLDSSSIYEILVHT